MFWADCFTLGRTLFSNGAQHEKKYIKQQKQTKKKLWLILTSSQILFFSSADSSCSGKCQVP